MLSTCRLLVAVVATLQAYTHGVGNTSRGGRHARVNYYTETIELSKLKLGGHRHIAQHTSRQRCNSSYMVI